MAPNGTTVVIPKVTSQILDASSQSSRFFSTKKINVILDDHNYFVWHQQVFLTIKTHRLLRFIDSNVQPPHEHIVKDSQSIINPDFEAFKEQDGALVSWLLSTVSENVLPYLIVLNSVSEIWNTLHGVFSGKTTSHLMYFRHLLHSQKKGDLSMKEFLMKVKSVCDNLAICGEIISEHEHVTAILNGLPSEYESTIDVLTSGTVLSTVSISANPTHHARVKHVEIDLYFVRERVQNGRLLVNFVPYSEQVSDILTKPIPHAFFHNMRCKIGVVSLNNIFQDAETRKMLE
ncbi:hypothetical protein GQ457_08G023370 [Hibiscus cannabinus]